VTALLRTRMAIVTIAMGIVAALASGVFDQWVWSLGIAVVVPAAVSISVRRWSPVARLLAGVAGIGASVALVVAVEGGDVRDVVDAVGAGAQRLLTTEWPSPDQPDLIGAIALVIAAATALTTDIAGRLRWHLLAWLPIVTAFVAIIGLSAPLGERVIWLVPLGLLGAVFAAFRPDTELADRWATLRGERRLIPLLLVAGITAAAVSVPITLSVRADPRRNDPASQTAALIDPIESTLALRDLDPVIDLHRISVVDTAGRALPIRWRTAALSDYDGQRWTPALTLRPIGGRLAPDATDQIVVDVAFLDDDLSLVPFPGAPITVGAAVETDPTRTVVRLTERRDDTPLTITSAVAPTLADAQVSGIASRAVDDSVSSLNEFAATLAGEGSIIEQLRRIESTMRDDWVLASNAPGGGLQRTLIERFLRDTQRGTAEQFATAYVLLARSLGVDARVATGFVATSPPTDTSLVLTSADAQVWPEVRLVDGGWIALDPVPPEEASDVAPPDVAPAVQTPAAAQPPIAPPPEVSNDTTLDDTALDDAGATTLSSLRLWAQRIALALSVLLLPAFVTIAVILAIKGRRRRRRLTGGQPSARVVGAWAIATDRLVDAGLSIKPSATDGDIAASGVSLVGNAARELRRLATLSSAVTFGAPERPDLLAEDAATCLSKVETTMAEQRTHTDRLKWRLSLRSLRRQTRSPVAD
jgi:transglutaminase-like putative cysteine protease